MGNVIKHPNQKTRTDSAFESLTCAELAQLFGPTARGLGVILKQFEQAVDKDLFVRSFIEHLNKHDVDMRSLYNLNRWVLFENVKDSE